MHPQSSPISESVSTYLFSTKMSNTVSANHTFLGLTSPPENIHRNILSPVSPLQFKSITRKSYQITFFFIFELLIKLERFQCLPAICLIIEYTTISAPCTLFFTISLMIQSNWNDILPVQWNLSFQYLRPLRWKTTLQCETTSAEHLVLIYNDFHLPCKNTCHLRPHFHEP